MPSEPTKVTKSPEDVSLWEDPSLPPNELKLKVGVVVMLLHNLDLSKGLCAGSRLVVSKIGSDQLECTALGGARQTHLIPKITLKSYGKPPSNMPFKRRQFPVRVAFAMTMHKGQGQTLEHVGIDLRGI